MMTETISSTSSKRPSRRSVAPLGRERRLDFGGLVAEQVARGVDAVDPDVVECSATELPLEADVVGILHLHREVGAEDPRLSDRSLLDEVDRGQVGALEVQPVRDHQLDLVLLGDVDHRLALGRRRRHRFLAQDVDARIGGHAGVLRVHRVRQRDVNRVDLAASQELRQFRVVDAALDAVLRAELAQFGRIVGNEGRELDFFACANAGRTATCAM
jgi:hypothetical protein